MVLYTCKYAKHDLPGPIKAHPCANAVRALDAAGHTYELRHVDGLRALPWTTRSGAREEVERLSGQRLVPILVLDDDTVISSSGEIVAWAKSNPAG